MAFLTDRTLASGVTSNDLIHIVITGDTSQNPAGSSYKATMGQVLDLINPTTLTGGTYDPITGTITFYDDNGGSFNVTGLVTGYTNTAVTAFTYDNANTFTVLENDGTTHSASFNIVTGLTINGNLVITGLTSSGIVSATTYQNLPTDVRVTGGTYSAGTATFTNNTGGTFNVSGFTQPTQKAWGSFISLVDQTGGVPGTTYKMSADTTTSASGVTLSGGSRFVVTNPGVYNIQFSAQLNKTSGTKSLMFIWLSKNGTPVTASSTEITLDGGSNERIVAAWNWVDEATTANTYYEIEWTDTQGNVFLDYVASPTYGPAIPSVIVTVTQV